MDLMDDMDVMEEMDRRETWIPAFAGMTNWRLGDIWDMI